MKHYGRIVMAALAMYALVCGVASCGRCSDAVC